MADKKEFINCISYLKAYYPNFNFDINNKLMLDVWYQSFNQVDNLPVLIRNYTLNNKFPPLSPNDILEYLNTTEYVVNGIDLGKLIKNNKSQYYIEISKLLEVNPNKAREIIKELEYGGFSDLDGRYLSQCEKDKTRAITTNKKELISNEAKLETL